MLENEIFSINGSNRFLDTALKVFNLQFQENPVYRQYCELLKKSPDCVSSLEEIPFLPVEFFKSHKIKTGNLPVEVVFTSSGTTTSKPSRHYVSRLGLYEQSFLNGFRRVYGDPKDYVILALLPSYLERKGSSLVYMAERLIRESGDPSSGFFLNRNRELIDLIYQLESRKQRTILLGVSFALLDLTELEQFKLKNTVVMETGGMKGRRREMIRAELHQRLREGFGTEKIHSEYGMTELLSQAYSKGDGLFRCPPWMKVLTRDTEDPLNYVTGTTGGVNVIDLANLDSVAFLATQDLGKVYPDGSFEILGRFDHSDIRGCNLMAL